MAAADHKPPKVSAVGHSSTARLDARAEGVWYAVLAFVCLVVVGAGLIATAAVSPTFCNLCHGDMADALQTTSHSTADCDTCHVGNGTMGLTENRLGVVSMVYGAPFEWIVDSSVSGTTFGNERCLACHEGIETGVVEVNGIRMSHRAPVEAKWLCVDCHRGVAHPAGVHTGASYSMDMCLECHSAGLNNLASCDICHVSDQRRTGDRPPTAWKVTHGENWERMHGMGDLGTCRACHADGYCVACHNLSLPHPANFMSAHGQLVVEQPGIRGDCRTCHPPNVCSNCHGMDMPHPDGFTEAHPKQVSDDGTDACYRCHAEESCTTCHERHTHPGLPVEQLELLQNRPVRLP